MKEKLLSKLDKFSYKYKVEGETVVIDLGAYLEMSVKFNGEKIEIKDKLRAWNFLTGMMNMSIKQSVVYNTIAVVVAVIIIMIAVKVEHFDASSAILISIMSMTWVLIWTIYYTFVAEQMKSRIINWLN